MFGSINWWPIVLLFMLPLGAGTVCLVLASRFPCKWERIAVRAIASVLFTAFVAAAVVIAPYLWALHLEARWYPAHPTTQAQLESFLSMYSQRQIQPSQSGWGRDHKLQAGERMIQYRLLYSAPLDVVYTSSNTIVAIYTSYE